MPCVTATTFASDPAGYSGGEAVDFRREFQNHEAVAYLDGQHDNRHHVSPALRTRVDEMIELEVFLRTLSRCSFQVPISGKVDLHGSNSVAMRMERIECETDGTVERGSACQVTFKLKIACEQF